MEPKIDVEPDAWATKTMCIGPQYGKTRYDKLPIQCTQPGYYTHEKLYSEKTVIGLMKAAYYNGYTDREEALRKLQADLAAMTKKADGFFDALQLAAKINAEGQAREQQLREALEYYASFDYSDDSCPVAEDAQQALAIPQDDTALRQWGAKLLREMADLVSFVDRKTLHRKADELEAGR